MPNPFYTNNQFSIKQFSLTWLHSLIGKNISISSYSIFSQTVLIQTIQFTVSTVSMSKTVLFQTIQFSISTWFSPI